MVTGTSGRRRVRPAHNERNIVSEHPWRVFLAAIGAIAAVVGISVGIWAIRVATSDVAGRGNAIIKVNDADNRLFAQGHFLDLYNEVIASDQKLDQAARDKAEHPGDDFYATNYTGLQNHCIDTRNQYNAAARKITEAKFRDEDLPYQIDETDPKFDCKESADAVPTMTGSAK